MESSTAAAAPKEQQNLAQGFNPGVGAPIGHALKVAADWGFFADARWIVPNRSHQILRPFRARHFEPLNPGLKPLG